VERLGAGLVAEYFEEFTRIPVELNALSSDIETNYK
jgi:hypothetical protein